MPFSSPSTPVWTAFGRHILTWISHIIYSAFSTPACLVCQRRMSGAGICSSCLSEKRALLVPAPYRCPACFRPGSPKNTRCEDCSVRDPDIRQVRSLLVYNDQIKRIIRAMKFDGRPPIAKLLGAKMATEISHAFPKRDWDLVIPIPISAIRLKSRGYNQSAVIARLVANNVKLPTIDALRVRASFVNEGSQSLKSYRARLQLRKENPFTLCSPKVADLIRGQRILLIDDVITTGATALAATQILLANGVKSVDIYTSAISQSWDGWASAQ